MINLVKTSEQTIINHTEPEQTVKTSYAINIKHDYRGSDKGSYNLQTLTSLDLNWCVQIHTSSFSQYWIGVLSYTLFSWSVLFTHLVC